MALSLLGALPTTLRGASGIARKSSLPDAELEDSTLDMPVAKRGKPYVISPHPLSSGPESGLCNQLFALIGYAIMARHLKASLVLPKWTSHDNGGYAMAFESLFQPEPFVRAMHRLGIRILREPPSNKTHTVFTPTNLVGWRTYKLMQHSYMNISIFEKSVLLALHPSQRIQRQVQAAQHAELDDKPYGCFHARIERDMARSWLVNHAGPAPLLNPMLESMAREPMITRYSRILVAVGVDITEGDEKTLNTPTAWNATMRRVQTGKTYNRVGKFHPKSKNASEQKAYIDAALVDFQLCREADWLVGWPGSTFARALGFYHTNERGAWFLTCGNTTMWHETNREKWQHHTACVGGRDSSDYKGGAGLYVRTRYAWYDFRGLENETRVIDEHDRRVKLKAIDRRVVAAESNYDAPKAEAVHPPSFSRKRRSSEALSKGMLSINESIKELEDKLQGLRAIRDALSGSDGSAGGAD